MVIFDLPERELWCAVLRQAIDDYFADPFCNADPRKQSEIRFWKDRAEHWLFRSKKTNIGSLGWICSNLGWNVECVRKALR